MSDKEDPQPPELRPPKSELDNLDLIFDASSRPRVARQRHFLQRHLLRQLIRQHRRMHRRRTVGPQRPAVTSGLAGSTRRYALLVALMVGLTALPTWIVLRAGVEGVDPWVAGPVRPFVVPGDSVTPQPARPLVPGGRPTRPAPQADPAQAQPAPVPPAVIALPPAPPVPVRERTRWDSAADKQRPVWKRTKKKVTSRPTPVKNVPPAPHQPPSQGSNQGNPNRPAPWPVSRSGHRSGQPAWAHLPTRRLGSHWVGKHWVGKHWAGKRWAGKRWVGKQWVGKRWLRVDRPCR